MDPDETLALMRGMVAALNNPAAQDSVSLAEAGEMLAGYVEAMDEWLSRGGFLPDAWSRP